MPKSMVKGGWYVYIVKCKDQTLYVGITVDIEERLRKHNQGTASKYTRSRTPVVLVYKQRQATRSSATRREIALKKLTREEKLLLIASKAKKRDSRTRKLGPILLR